VTAGRETERTWGTWDRLRATSARSGELLATKALPGFGMLALRVGRAAAPASPGYWAMSALRAALQGQPGATLRAAAVLLAVAGVTAALAPGGTPAAGPVPGCCKPGPGSASGRAQGPGARRGAPGRACSKIWSVSLLK
jgi:hypothetical protein